MNVLLRVVVNADLLQGNGVVSHYFLFFFLFQCLLLIGCEDDMISTDSEEDSSWLEVDSDGGVGFASHSDW